LTILEGDPEADRPGHRSLVIFVGVDDMRHPVSGPAQAATLGSVLF
jgi:hypothetical protein